MHEPFPTPAEPERTILLVDDQEGEFLLVRRMLGSIRTRPYRVHWSSTAEEALLVVHQLPRLDAILLDVALGGERNGLDLLIDLVAQGLAAPCIMLTVHTDEAFEARCIRAGAEDYLSKSDLSAQQLHRAISNACERHRMRRELALSERRYRTLAANFPKGAVLGADRDGICCTADGSALPALGIDPRTAPTTPLLDLLQSDLGDRIAQHLASRAEPGVHSYETTINDHCMLVHHCAMGDDGHQLVFLDVTELRQAEATMLQSSRLAAIGTLTSGIAHEFNNLYAVIGGALERLMQPPSENPERRRRLQTVHDGIHRAAEVTRSLLALARGFRATFEYVALEQIVDETLALLDRDFADDGIAVERAFAPMPRLWLQPAGIGQVLFNLLLNARHACRGRDAPRITVRGALDGDDAVLSVEDNGCGIDPAQRERIFTPFYTSRTGTGADAGTGLGLTVCSTIVAHHDGRIDVRSEPGAGSCFTVRLPCQRDDHAPRSPGVAGC